jgi:hypothetical protein
LAMNRNFSSGCFTIKPPPFVLSSSASAKTAAASTSELNGSLRFSGEKGKMNRLTAEFNIERQVRV